MKQTTIREQLRQAASVNRGNIIANPGFRTYRSWPLCLTCGREVDSCELRNVTAKSVEVWAGCYHLSPGDEVPDGMKINEDYVQVNFEFRNEGNGLDGESTSSGDYSVDNEQANWAIKRAMHDFCPFDPSGLTEGRKASARAAGIVFPSDPIRPKVIDDGRTDKPLIVL